MLDGDSLKTEIHTSKHIIKQTIDISLKRHLTRKELELAIRKISIHGKDYLDVNRKNLIINNENF